MTTRTNPADVNWSVYLDASPERVYSFLSTDDGRAQFWAERTSESNGTIEFEFPNGAEYEATLHTDEPPRRFALDYFGSQATFTLASEDGQSTILTVSHSEIAPSKYCDTLAGWVSVLLTLKGVVNHGIDLRNHEKMYTWERGFVGN